MRDGGDTTTTADRASADELLAEFVSGGRDEAFAEVVRRYAGMVFAVCLRVAGNPHDAEDATQATFLTLAVQCKSGKSVRWLGPWLRQVATRAALDVRRARKRRETHEQRHAGQRLHEAASDQRDRHRNGHPAALAAISAGDIDLEKLSRVMAEEIGRLPPKYRLPIVCLYYSGMDRAEVAKELGCTPGTLGVRVHRARQMLARRLNERGVAPQGDLLAGGLLTAAIAAAGALAVLERTACAAAKASLGCDLASATSAHVLGVLKVTTITAVLAKLKGVAAVVLLLGVVAVAAGGATRELSAIQARLPAILRRVAEWVRQTPSWKISLPHLGTPGGVTPVAAVRKAAVPTVTPTADSALVTSRPWYDRDLVSAATLLPAGRETIVRPVQFLSATVDEAPPASPLALYEPASAGAPSVVLIAMDESPGFGSSHALPVPADLQVCVAREQSQAVAMPPVATPEPSAACFALFGGILLLRRRRR